MVLTLYVKQPFLQLYSEGEISYGKIVKRLRIQSPQNGSLGDCKVSARKNNSSQRGLWKTFQAHIRYSNSFPSYRGDPFPKYFTVIVSITIAQISFEQCLPVTG